MVRNTNKICKITLFYITHAHQLRAWYTHSQINSNKKPPTVCDIHVRLTRVYIKWFISLRFQVRTLFFYIPPPPVFVLLNSEKFQRKKRKIIERNGADETLIGRVRRRIDDFQVFFRLVLWFLINQSKVSCIVFANLCFFRGLIEEKTRRFDCHWCLLDDIR